MIAGAIEFDGRPVNPISGISAALQVFSDDRVWIAGTICSVSDRYVVVADGELYSGTDGEPTAVSIARGFERWGESVVARLDGAYAFAVWSRCERRLIGARDHFGLLPLFYACRGGRLAFASEINVLRSLPWITGDLCRDRITDFVLGNPVVGTRTFYADIMRVLPGAVLSVDARTFRHVRYWRLESIARSPVSPSNPSSVLRELITTAVRQRIPKTGTVGIYLSGGVDSTTVACTAAAILAERGADLHAFTFIPPAEGVQLSRGWVSNEMPAVELLRRFVPNLSVEYVRVGDRTPLTGLDDDWRRTGRPTRGLFSAPWTRALRDAAIRKGVKTVLTGFWGDGSWSWSGQGYLRDAVRHLQIRPILNACSWPAGLVPLRARIARRWLVDGGNWFIRDSIASEELIRDPHVRRRMRTIATLEMAVQHDPTLNQQQEFYWGLGEPELVAQLHNPIDLRHPAVHRSVMEFCLAMPSWEYSEAGRGRALLRKAMAGIVPAEILDGTQRGIPSVGITSWAHDDLRVIAEDLHAFARSHEVLSLLNLQQLSRLVRRMAGEQRVQVQLQLALPVYDGYALAKFIAMGGSC